MRNVVIALLAVVLLLPVQAEETTGSFEALLLEAGTSLLLGGEGPWREILDSGQLAQLKALQLRPGQIEELIGLALRFSPQLLDPQADAALLVDQLTPQALAILDQSQREMLERMDLRPDQLSRGVHWVRNEVSHQEMRNQEFLNRDQLTKLQNVLPDGARMLREALRTLLERTD